MYGKVSDQVICGAAIHTEFTRNVSSEGSGRLDIPSSAIVVIHHRWRSRGIRQYHRQGTRFYDVSDAIAQPRSGSLVHPDLHRISLDGEIDQPDYHHYDCFHE